MKINKFISSWFSLFLLGLCCASPACAGTTGQKLDRLDNNMNLLLNNVKYYQNSLTQAENELRKSNLLLVKAETELEKLDKELELSKMECEAMKQSLWNANNLLKSYEQTMKAKLNKQKRQKYLYATLAIGAIIYAKSK